MPAAALEPPRARSTPCWPPWPLPWPLPCGARRVKTNFGHLLQTQALLTASVLCCGCEMDTVTSLLKWVSDWVGRLAHPSEKDERARARLAVKEEQAKPAGQRNEKRLLALLEEDKMWTYDYCRVCWSRLLRA